MNITIFEIKSTRKEHSNGPGKYTCVYETPKPALKCKFTSTMEASMKLNYGNGRYHALEVTWALKTIIIGIDHYTVCAGVVCAATPGTARVGRSSRGRAGRPHEYCAGSGSTNHDSADRMSGQLLFYHENEATHNDKSRDHRDHEPPCWNTLAGNAIVMMKASIDTVPE